jgi:hypothetical protein
VPFFLSSVRGPLLCSGRGPYQFLLIFFSGINNMDYRRTAIRNRSVRCCTGGGTYMRFDYVELMLEECDLVSGGNGGLYGSGGREEAPSTQIERGSPAIGTNL